MYTLLSFSANWCEPCKWAEPVIHDVVEHFDGKLELRKIDIDTEPAIAREHHILSVPTFVLMNGDVEMWRMNGFDLAPNMIRSLGQHIPS